MSHEERIHGETTGIGHDPLGAPPHAELKRKREGASLAGLREMGGQVLGIVEAIREDKPVPGAMSAQTAAAHSQWVDKALKEKKAEKGNANKAARKKHTKPEE